MEKNSLPLLALTMPAYNEEGVIPHSAKKIHLKLQELVQKNVISESSFALFVNDGSKDNTWNEILEASSKYENIRGACLSSNKGHQTALLAGLEYVSDKCDCAISLDADLQHDINAFEDFLTKYQEGNDIVFGVREERRQDTFYYRIIISTYYYLLDLMGIKFIPNHADYRLMSQKALNALKSHREANLYLRGLIPLMGFKQDQILFKVTKREHGDSKYNYKRLIHLAVDGITSLSSFPLRALSVIGVFVIVFSFFMILYILLQFFRDKGVPGWASTVIPIYFIGGVQLFCMGVIGEYLGKVYIEVKRRPRYIISEECGDTK